MSIGDAAPTPTEPEPVRTPPGGRVVTIGAVMAMIAVIAVCLSLMRQSKPVGAIGLVFVATATMHAIGRMLRRKGRGQTLRMEDFLVTAAVSVLVAILVYLAAVVAFAATCFSVVVATDGRFGGLDGLAVALYVGLFAAVVAAALAFWKLWRVGD